MKLLVLARFPVKPSAPVLQHLPSSKGSTLVEIVITMGIIMTAIIPLISMLSIAMDTSREAAVKTIGSRIAASLASQVQQEDWNSVSQWESRTSYYDEQGEPLNGQSASEKSAYTARVAMPTQGMAYNTASGQASNPWARQVNVLVTLRPGSNGLTTLNAAQAAIENGQPVPKDVLLSRTMIVNLQKQPSPTTPAVTSL